MKHATKNTLNSFQQFLTKLDAQPQLQQKKLGVYYLKSKAFLHFHEDSSELYADVRLDGVNFERLPATTKLEQNQLLSQIRKSLE